jgi:tyrosine-protein kinase Etk/Wzc
MESADSRIYSSFFRLIWSERKTIIRITAVATVLVTLYSFVMPHTYSSTVTILPPKSEDRGLGLMDVLSGGATADMADLSATLGFGSRPSDIFVKILNSRTVSDSLILKYKLQDFFGISRSQSWRYAAAFLADATNVESSKDDMVTVTVSLSTSYFPSGEGVDRVKKLAADIANDYIRCLDVVNKEKLVSSARKSRIYIQEQLIVTRKDLEDAYDILVDFQESHKALMIDKQMDALVTTAAAIKTQLAEASFELGLAKRDLKPDSRSLMDLQARVDELQTQYNKLQAGSAGDADFVIAFAKLPRVAKELSMLVRRVKILEEVNVFLNKQYYKDRLQEARDTPTVQVLDSAIPAFRRTSPRRLQWLLTSFIVSLLASIAFVIGRESLRSHKARRRAQSA